MQTENKHLKHDCEIVRDAVSHALSWVENTTNESAANNAGLVKELRKSVVHVGKLAKAADRKMCVGVYGASQAGKSYLISTLARNADNPLLARYGNNTVDFIKHINPEGGGESTGLVTRFTMDRAPNATNDFPIKAALLSELDIVKILSNSFVFDIRHEDEIDTCDFEETVLKTLTELDTAPVGVSPLKIEDVYDLEEYCNQKLIRSPYFQALKRIGFWDRSAGLVPHLSKESRAILFALLWQNMPIFNRIYAVLTDALDRIGHATEVFCAPEALFRTEGSEWSRDTAKSIINVSALEGLVNSDGDDGICVRMASGQTVEVSRAQLGALIAELVIFMEYQPHDFFDYTDLLDFPGARTRSPNENNPQELEKPEKVAGIYLRGKVAYLFDRYCDEQELTSMLLCVGDSNQEVAEVPITVEEWISKTHGRSPEDRAGRQTSLFFIMTKFDTGFVKAAGKGTDNSRWKTRMDYSLIKAFSQKSPNTRWVNEWTPGQPFNNVFWVRNPYFLQQGLFDYISTDPIVERGVREYEKAFVEEIFDGYLKCDEVKKYFRDPARAFNAAMEVNDGGISYLIEHIRPICNPDLKRNQIRQNIEHAISQLLGLLGPYYVDSDLAVLTKKKTAEAVQVLRSLAIVLKQQKMGEFLNIIRISEEESYEVFLGSEHLATSVITGTAKQQDDTTGNVHVYTGGDDIDEMLGLGDFANEGTDTGADEAELKQDSIPQPQDLAAKFVVDLEAAWTSKMFEFADNVNALHYFGLEAETVRTIAREFMKAAHGRGLFAQLAELVRDAQQHKAEQQESYRWKQVAPVCGMFNEYVATLGYGGVFAEEGSIIRDLGDRQIHIFKPMQQVGAETLPERFTDSYRTRFVDWSQAVQATIRDNARIDAGIAGDSEDNERLGRVIAQMRSCSKGVAA